MSMTTILKHGTWILAVAVGLGITAGTTQAVAAPFQDHDRDQQQKHEPDYSKDKRYQQGVREGRDDHAHSRDHSKKRHFKNDNEQRSYEAGYQKGRGN